MVLTIGLLRRSQSTLQRRRRLRRRCHPAPLPQQPPAKRQSPRLSWAIRKWRRLRHLSNRITTKWACFRGFHSVRTTLLQTIQIMTNRNRARYKYHLPLSWVVRTMPGLLQWHSLLRISLRPIVSIAPQWHQQISLSINLVATWEIQRLPRCL